MISKQCSSDELNNITSKYRLPLAIKNLIKKFDLTNFNNISPSPNHTLISKSHATPHLQILKRDWRSETRARQILQTNQNILSSKQMF